MVPVEAWTELLAGGLLSCENEQSECQTLFCRREDNTDEPHYSQAAARLGVVENPQHVRKECAREPGSLQNVCASRPVREGEIPVTRACTSWRIRTAR